MTPLLAVLPLVVALLVALTRSTLWGGVTGVALALVVGLLYAPLALRAATLPNVLGRAVVGTLLVGYIIFFGLVLYEVLAAGGAVTRLVALLARGLPTPERQTLGVALALGCAVEALSGFGAGALVVAPLLVGLGFPAGRAAVLALFSQSLVPWGALAVGLLLGAEIARLPARDLSLATALVQVPVLVWYALTALWFSGGGRRGVPRALATGLVMGGAVVAASWLGWVELAGLVGGLAGLGVALVGRRATGKPTLPDGLPGAGRALVPYAVLALALVVTRLPALAPSLARVAVIVSPDGQVRLPLLYSPGCWLLVSAGVAVAVLRVPGRALPALLVRSVRRWWPATLALFAYLLLAEVMRADGATAALARALGAGLGGAYLAAAPVIGGLGGFLTGSNAGANASLMGLQLAAARAAGLDPGWIAALQNNAASNFTLASPSRTLLAASAAGFHEGATPVLRRGLTIEAGVLLVLLLVAFLGR